MRILLCTILSVGMLGGTYAAVSWHRNRILMEESLFTAALEGRRGLEREIRIRAATQPELLNDRGWPITVDPAWFAGNPPRNPFVPRGHPWVEIASEAEADLTDPPIRQALTPDVAAYWYNPSSGVVRARVGPDVTDARAVEMYNRLNGSDVKSLFSGDSPKQASASAGGGAGPSPKIVRTSSRDDTRRPRGNGR